MTTWADMRAVLDAAKPHVRGIRGREQAETSKTKSRASVWRDRDAAIQGLSGVVGTGLPEYADPLKPVMDPEYVLARNILRDFESPERWRARPQAAEHREIPDG